MKRAAPSNPHLPCRIVAGARINPRHPLLLAFWALWHCRHARPPDAWACPTPWTPPLVTGRAREPQRAPPHKE